MGIMRTMLLTLLLALLSAPTSRAFGQSLTEQMQDLLERGYYNSAATVNGPALVARFPNDPQAHYLFAQALYLTNDLTEARRELDRTLQLSGSPTPEITHLDGLLKALEGNSKIALEDLRTAFEATGSYQYAMDWGRIAWQAGRYDEALEAYDAAAKTNRGSNSLWPYLNRGRILLFLGRYQDAIVAFTTVIDVFDANDLGTARPSPAYVEAFFRLGEVYEQLGDVEQAKNNYRASLSADPNYTPADDALTQLTKEAGE